MKPPRLLGQFVFLAWADINTAIKKYTQCPNGVFVSIQVKEL